MPKSYIKQNSWSKVSLFCFFLTISAGFFLRLQFAGYFSSFDKIDIRQMHTHLGFYGFLFPLLWAITPAYGFWVPGKLLRWIYILLLTISMIGFGLSGYGLVSHISSFFILLIWLLFGFKNIKISFKGSRWICAIPIGVVISAALVSVVLIITKSGSAISIPQVVRIFLTVLLFSVFGSLALEQISKPIASVYFWLIGLLGLGLYLSDLSFHGYFVWAPFVVGSYLFLSLFRERTLDALRLKIYWVVFAVSLVGMSLGMVINNHFTAVSGIHYAVFLLIAVHFLSFKNKLYQYSYEFFSILMVISIYSQNLISWSYKYNQICLVIVSAGVLIAAFFGISKIKAVNQIST